MLEWSNQTMSATVVVTARPSPGLPPGQSFLRVPTFELLKARRLRLSEILPKSFFVALSI